MGVGVGEEEGGSTRTASRERGIGVSFFAERVGGRDEKRKRKMGMVVRCIFRGSVASAPINLYRSSCPVLCILLEMQWL